MTMSLLENLFAPGTIERLGWMLVHFLWQAAIVALLLAAMLRLLRHAGANLRYAVACSALALMVVLPLVTMRFVVVAGPVAEAGPALVDLSPSPVALLPTVGTVEKIVAETPAPAAAPIEVPASPAAADLPASAVAWQERIVSLLEPALPYLVLGWVIGVFGLSTWHLGGWAQLQRLKRRMVRAIGTPLQRRLEELSARLGLHRPVGLLESALVEVPTVVGWLRPVILLPASALTGLRPEQLEAILAHELAHIRRYDYLVNMLQTVVEILGFYHPAVWWVSRRVRIERENCCDDLAVYVCGSSLQYAKALACMEEIRHGGTDLAVAATGGSLIARIARLLGRPAVEDRRFAWLPGLVALLLVVALVIPAALTLGAGNPLPSSTDTQGNYQTPRQEHEAQAASASPSSEGAAPQVDEKEADTGRAEAAAPNAPDETGQVLLEFQIAKVWSDLRPDRETLLALANAMGAESPLARELARSGRQFDMTLGEVLRRYVAPQSQPAAQALLVLLESRGYLKMLSKPSMLAQDNKPAHLRAAEDEHFVMPRGSSKPERIAHEIAVDVTPHLMADNRVALDILVELTEPMPGVEDSNRPKVSRTSAETSMIAPNDRYLVWAAMEQPASQTDADKGRQSLYVMVRPVILRPAAGYAGPAGTPRPAPANPRQVLLDVRTVTMERDALLNLGVEWSWPTVKAGVFPGPSGNTPSPGADGKVQIGYTADHEFTESLLAALDLLQENRMARVSAQQILAQDGHQSRIKALTEEWYTVTTTTVEARKMETGTVVTIKPRLGDNGTITLETTVETSTSLPRDKGSELPILTRRTARNAVTIRDGGTVAVAGMTENRAGPNDKSVREMALFVTAHLIPDGNEATPASSGTISPEQQMLLRQEHVNSDPVVRELSRRIVATEQELLVLRQKFVSTHPTVVQKNALLEASRQTLDQKRTELQEEFDRGLAERLRTAARRGGNQATVTATFASADLLQILAEMSQRSGMKITPDLTVKATPVTAELADVPVETALLQVLENTPYTFRRLDDGTYLVFRPLSFTFPQVELIRALQDLSAAAAVAIIPDPNVAGTVNARFDNVSLDEALEMLLAGKLYVFKRMTHYYLVVDRRVGPTVPDASETRRIRLSYVPAPRAKALLNPVYAPYVQVEPSRVQDPNDKGNTLIIRGITESCGWSGGKKRRIILAVNATIGNQGKDTPHGTEYVTDRVFVNPPARCSDGHPAARGPRDAGRRDRK